MLNTKTGMVVSVLWSHGGLGSHSSRPLPSIMTGSDRVSPAWEKIQMANSKYGFCWTPVAFTPIAGLENCTWNPCYVRDCLYLETPRLTRRGHKRSQPRGPVLCGPLFQKEGQNSRICLPFLTAFQETPKEEVIQKGPIFWAWAFPFFRCLKIEIWFSYGETRSLERAVLRVLANPYSHVSNTTIKKQNDSMASPNVLIPFGSILSLSLWEALNSSLSL